GYRGGLRNLREPSSAKKVELTAGQGIEALRARYLSLILSSLTNESRHDVLTTLRAQPEAFQKN
ncbi:MAG: hypothetical protein M3M89_05825, partial [Thermoproteota archaeon]|nr:hypothetical protein [Thermoproteota archaeon]